MPKINHLNHRESFNGKKIRLISFISFLMGFAQAFFIYVMSTYFKVSSGLENVGFFYLVSYSVSFLVFFNLHKITQKIGKADLFHLSLAVKLVAICFLAVIPPSWWGVFWVMIYIIFGNIEWVSLDVILETYSTDSMSGRIRGKYLTVANAGILLGPFLSTFILDRYDFSGLFLLLLFFNVAISAVAIHGVKKVGHSSRHVLPIKKIAQKFLHRPNVRKIYGVSFALDFFYALTIIYVPLHLHNLGLGWDEIGFVLTVMLIPFVLIQYPVGSLADKKTGEKEMLSVGVFVMAVSALGMFFLNSKSILAWTTILCLGRSGAAVVEILRDSYFYKRIDARDVDIINIFRTSKSLAYIISSALSGFLLFVFPIKSVFILVIGVSLLALWPIFHLADNRSEKELLRKNG